MTRIIAGSAGSLSLEVPDAGTRPTSDRVRESLFGALESADAIQDAVVLDLYAGSGALGLEAASRGAASVDLIEKAPRAASVVQRNAAKVGAGLAGAASGSTPQITVHRASADTFLRSASRSFDLVFVDPPYDIGERELATTLELLAPHVAPDAVVIIERARRSPEPVLPASLTTTRSKRYGDTMLWWVTTA